MSTRTQKPPPRLTLDAPPVVEPPEPKQSPEPGEGEEGPSRSSPRGLAAVLMLALLGLLTPMLFPKAQPPIAAPSLSAQKIEKPAPPRLSIAASPSRAAGRAVAPPAAAMLSRSDRTPMHVEKLVAPLP